MTNIDLQWYWSVQEIHNEHRKIHWHNSSTYKNMYARIHNRGVEKAVATPSMGHWGKREYNNLKDVRRAARDGCSYDNFIKK